MPLTDIAIRKLQHSGKPAGDKHADGLGMYLRVKAAGKYWRMDYRFDGKHKTLALGVYPEVSLAAARTARAEARAQLAKGIDPAAAKQDAKRAPATEAEHTFRAVAEEWLLKTADRAPKTTQKITGWLNNDLYPAIGGMPVAEIRPRDVLAAVRQVEARGALDSAGRMLQLCGQIFRYAIAATLIEVDVTSGLRGALATPVIEHHAAITDPVRVGGLMRAIEGYEGHHSVVGALRMAPLVFVRPGELRTAEWVEIDLDAAEWRIPAPKMKMKIEHIVPLSAQALAILRHLKPLTGAGRFVFPGLRSSSTCISDAAVNAALRALGYSKEVMTGHGFRAMARTIMDEVMGERVDLIEHQLAHVVKDVNGRAYNRTTHLAARREMMQRWADYLDGLKRGADIIPLRTPAQPAG
jgi:integrase